VRIHRIYSFVVGGEDPQDILVSDACCVVLFPLEELPLVGGGCKRRELMFLLSCCVSIIRVNIHRAGRGKGT